MIPHMVMRLSVGTGFLMACVLSGCMKTESAAPAPVENPRLSTVVIGSISGEHFFPEFQRLQIVDVTPAADSQVPADLRGIPVILRGRYIHLSTGYFSYPFVNGGGEVLSPACFRSIEEGLEVIPIRGGTPSRTLLIRRSAGEQLQMALDELFVMTLKAVPLANDEGYQKRALDAHYNLLLSRGVPRSERISCDLQPAVLPPYVNGDVQLVIDSSDRRITVAGADLDPNTPIDVGSASHEQRRNLDPGDPENFVSGCRGEQLIVRLVVGRTDISTPSTKFENFIFGAQVGQMETGELCERVRFLRRIEPEKLYELFNLSLPEQRFGSTPEIPVRLLKWEAGDTFRAAIGNHEFKLAEVEQPQIRVRLLSPAEASAASAFPMNRRPQGIVEPVTPEIEAAPPARSVPISESGLSTQPSLVGESRIYRWVDENNVVHYSDRAVATPNAVPMVPPEPTAEQTPTQARAQVERSIQLVRGTRAGISEFYVARGVWPDSLGAVPGAGPNNGPGVQSITVANGTIVIDFAMDAGMGVAGKRLTFRPTLLPGRAISWACGYATPQGIEPPVNPAAVVATNVDRIYLPAQCQ